MKYYFHFKIDFNFQGSFIFTEMVSRECRKVSISSPHKPSLILETSSTSMACLVQSINIQWEVFITPQAILFNRKRIWCYICYEHWKLYIIVACDNYCGFIISDIMEDSFWSVWISSSSQTQCEESSFYHLYRFFPFLVGLEYYVTWIIFLSKKDFCHFLSGFGHPVFVLFVCLLLFSFEYYFIVWIYHRNETHPMKNILVAYKF